MGLRNEVKMNWRQIITYNIMGHFDFTRKLMCRFLTALHKRECKRFYRIIKPEDVYDL